MQNKDVNYVYLSEIQLLYLNLYVFGYEDKEIYEILGVDEESGQEIKYFVKSFLGKKYKTDNWTEIIKRSFESEILDKYDHLRDVIKNQANIYSEKIFTEKCMDEVSFYDSSEPIKQFIQNFINTCDLVIETNNANIKLKK